MATSLDQIDFALRRHWSHTALVWFTDHGLQHSYNVAETALALGQPECVAEHLRLTPLEQYILSAAALLHDIGMNDLSLCSHPLGEMTPDDANMVRKMHAKRSGDLILGNRAAWGLPRDSVLGTVVALVAQAHGTEHYEPTLPLLQERSHVRNQEVRGPLLAALLLMADELDLHYERETELPEGWRLNPVSEAHAFKHRCVVSATTLCTRDGLLKIRLQLASGADGEVRDDIESWIVGKLRRQIGLTEAAVDEGFARQFRFDRAIRTEHQEVLADRPDPSDAALAVIRAEVAEDAMLNHRAPLKVVHRELTPGTLVAMAGRWDAAERSDLDGREALLKAAVARRRADPATVVVHSARLRRLGGGEVSDVLEEWIMQMGDPVLADRAHERVRRQQLLEKCAALVGAVEEQAVILSVSSIDALSMQAREWLVHHALPVLVAAAPDRTAVLATTSLDDGVRARNLVQVVVPMDTLLEPDLSADLSRYGNREFVRAAAGSGLAYDGLSRLTQSAAKELQGSVS